MTNLLSNPGFDGDFRAWNSIEEITVAQGWYPFWVPHRAQDEPWKNQRPIFRAALRALDSRRTRTGPAAQSYQSPWATHVAGIMQTVEATAGQHYALSAYGYAWSTNSDTPDQSIDPGNVRMRVGIDPSGGTNPFEARVVWSPERVNYDAYDKPFTVEAQAQASRITVFMLSAADWPKKHNEVFWDDIGLEAVAPASAGLTFDRNVVLGIASPTQQVGAEVTVDVTADRQLTNANLIVSGPQGALEPRLRMKGPGGRGMLWSWTFLPKLEGPYTVTFRSDEVPAVSSTIQISAPQPAAAAMMAVPQISGRGQPRTQYHRVYFLLPPTAGKDWIQAVVDSGAWIEKRWTVGFSADDAGIGDLDRRTVIVLNPSVWPDPIIPWLEMWYPGVAVQPITAVSPSDLRVLLRTVDPDNPPELG